MDKHDKHNKPKHGGSKGGARKGAPAIPVAGATGEPVVSLAPPGKHTKKTR
jgi:hypothetical protein